MTGQRTCFASRNIEEVLDFLRSRFYEIREGKLCADISGGDGATVLVGLREDQAQSAVPNPGHHIHPYAHTGSK